MTKEEFKYCFDNYFDSIRNHLYYRSGDVDLSTDIAQDVFMKVWEKQFPYSVKIKSLLYKMAGDMFVNQIRGKKVADRYLNSIDFNFKEDAADNKIQYEELKLNYEKALANLTEKKRTVFLMSRLEGSTYKEIAESLGVSIKTVEKRMSQTLKELKETLKQ